VGIGRSRFEKERERERERNEITNDDEKTPIGICDNGRDIDCIV